MRTRRGRPAGVCEVACAPGPGAGMVRREMRECDGHSQTGKKNTLRPPAAAGARPHPPPSAPADARPTAAAGARPSAARAFRDGAQEEGVPRRARSADPHRHRVGRSVRRSGGMGEGTRAWRRGARIGPPRSPTRRPPSFLQLQAQKVSPRMQKVVSGRQSWCVRGDGRGGTRALRPSRALTVRSLTPQASSASRSAPRPRWPGSRRSCASGAASASR